MSEVLWLRRYIPFLAAAALLHAGLFLGNSWKTSPVEIELHRGVRAVPLRLVRVARPFPTASRASEKPSPPMPVEPRPMEETQGLQEVTHKPSPLAPGVAMAKTTERVAPVSSEPAHVENQAETASLPSPTPSPVEPRQAELEASSLPSAVAPEGVVIEARAVSSRTPEYPSRSILRGEQGRVVVRLDVDSKGRARTIQLVQGSGHFRLDRSVLSFVREERFVPATRAGVPVDSSQTFSFRFELHNPAR